MENLYIVIPAYNEGPRIRKLLEKVLYLGYKNIIVVNDASTDNTRKEIENLEGVIILDHIINLGPGGATQTGLEYALKNNGEYIVTLDGDYQHNPEDISTLYQKIKKDKLDIVIGSRFKSKNKIPKSRIAFNYIGNFISYLLTGKYISDSQSGMKIISGNFARKIAIQTSGFEFCMEIIKIARSKNAKMAEVPISVNYSEETMQKGQSLFSGFSMLGRIFSPFN